MDKFFLPKGTKGRFKNQMIMHILGIVLMFDLMQMLKVSLLMIVKSVVEMVTGGNAFELLSQTEGVLEVLELYGIHGVNPDVFKTLGTISNVFTYVLAFITIGIAIFLIWLIKKQIEKYLEDAAPLGPTITVKKAKYVWLGFLLGMYGAHLFSIKKTKRAIIYLIMGLLSVEFPILMYYTLGISFTDAFLACYFDKDNKGNIEIEDYPYVI